MNEYEVPAVIADEFPETSNDIVYTTGIGNIYHTITVLSQLMRKKIIAHQFSRVFKCMELAGFIYERGNPAVKNAIENEFVYSFLSASQACSKKEWDFIKPHIPARLYSIYIKQVIGYGC